MFSFEKEGKYPYDLVIKKIGKISDTARKRAEADTETLVQLRDLLLADPDQRANKRQKINHDPYESLLLIP